MTIANALEWVGQVGPQIPKHQWLKIVVCPPFSDIEEVRKTILVGNFPMLVGSQDLSPFGEGAYTGEEPAKLLKEFVDLAIVGHSERRQNFGETDEMVAKKVKRALDNQIIPLVCVQSENTPVPDGCKLVAYEPIFAIGTGNPDTPENANQVARSLKQKHGQNLQVLYGGSVNSVDCRDFVAQENINGLLIGKASLDPQEFIAIVKKCNHEIR